MRSLLLHAVGLLICAAALSSCAAPSRGGRATPGGLSSTGQFPPASAEKPAESTAVSAQPVDAAVQTVSYSSLPADGTAASTTPAAAGALSPEEPSGLGQPPGWTLCQLEEVALNHHPGLAEAWARVLAARAKWLQVGLPPNPRTGYSGQQLGSRGQAEQDGVYIEQEIITARKRRRDRGVVCEEIQLAEQEFAAQRQRVLTDVRSSYFAVLAAQQRLELTQRLVDIGTQAARAVESLYQNQEGSRQEWLQARIEQRSAENLLWQAENAYWGAWRELTSVVGWGDDSPQPLLGQLDGHTPAYRWEEVWPQLLAESPELKMAQADLRRARQSLGRARAEAVPDLNVQGVVQHDNDTNATNGALLVTMPVPLFDRNQGGIRQAGAELMAAERAVERTELGLRRRLAATFERFATAAGQAENFRGGILQDAEESLRLTTRGYEAGELGYLELLTVQRTYFRANLDYVDTLLRLWTAAVEIEGQLLSDSLR